MGNLVKGMLLILIILYLASPIDVCPGPIDDFIVILIGLAAEKGVKEIED